MSLQNRIRAIVSVVMLIGAFMIFVPHNGQPTSDEDESAQANPNSDKSSELDWHGEQGNKNDTSNGNQTNSGQLTGQVPKSSNIRPLFFSNLNIGTTGANSSLSNSNLGAGQPVGPVQIPQQHRSMLPFQVNRPLKVDDADLIPIEPKAFSVSYTDEDADSIPHTIEFGETLQSISERYFGSPDEYLRIYEFNRDVLHEPINLPSGVQIQIPR